MTQGIVFKKAKGEAEDSNGKKIKFSDFLKGTHGSDSAKGKAGLTVKKALRKSKKKKYFSIFYFQFSIIAYLCE